MLLVLAVLAAILWLPSPWGLLLVIGAAIVEAVEVWFWIWWTEGGTSRSSGAEALVGAVARRHDAARPRRPRARRRGALAGPERASRPRAGERVVIQAVEPDLTLVVSPEQGKDPE